MLRLAQSGLKNAVALFQTSTPQSKPLILPEAKLRRAAEATVTPIECVAGSLDGTPETVVLLKLHSLCDTQMMPEPPPPVVGSDHCGIVTLVKYAVDSCVICT